MAGSESKGGTPVFASPECFEKKKKKSDIFSFGRVILFILLSKKRFMKWLFVPINNSATLTPTSIITLVLRMTSMTNRIDLQTSQIIFNEIRRNFSIRPDRRFINTLDSIVSASSNNLSYYISELNDFRLIFTNDV